MKSNLTKEQQAIVRSKAFKDWFGDWENDPENASKVVDENGEPLVVYHRTTHKFNEFNQEAQLIGWVGKGFYFSKNKDQFKKYGKVVLSVFLNVRKLFTVKGESPSDATSEVWKLNLNKQSNDSDISITLKENNYDGILFNHWDTGTIISCFNSTQIKLADGSNITFDVDNPDMRLNNGGELKIKEPYEIGDNTNFGIIEDKTASQYLINGKWIHRSLVTIVPLSKEAKLTNIISRLIKKNGAGNITLYHGTDKISYANIIKSGIIGVGEGVTFFTHDKSEAIQYAKNKSKYRNVGGDGKILEVIMPKYAVNQNRGTGEYETDFQLQKINDIYIPTPESLLAEYSQYKLGGNIKNDLLSLGSLKELGIISYKQEHDMVAQCYCGEKFSYKLNKTILWQCPYCKLPYSVH